MKPPAARATPPMTSKPTHSPQALASPRLVVAPRPNRKRAAAAESAKPTPSQRTSLSFRTLSIRFLFLKLHAPRNDPVHPSHEGQHPAEGVGHGGHGQAGFRRQGMTGNRMITGQEVKVYVGDIKH